MPNMTCQQFFKVLLGVTLNYKNNAVPLWHGTNKKIFHVQEGLTYVVSSRSFLVARVQGYDKLLKL